MKSYENLLVIAMEEAAEVQQELSKVLRFGINNYHPDDPSLSNGRRVMYEFNQLKAVISLLQDRNILPVLNDYEEKLIMDNKINAIKKWSSKSNIKD